MLSLAEMEALSPVPPGSPCDSSASEEQGRRKAAAAELAAEDLAEEFQEHLRAETKRALGSVTPSPLPSPVPVSAPPSPDSAPLVAAPAASAPGPAASAPAKSALPDEPLTYWDLVRTVKESRGVTSGEARRIVKEERLFTKGQVPVAAGAAAGAAVKHKAGATAAVKHKAGAGANMGEGKKSLLDKLAADGRIDTQEEYDVGVLLLKSQREMMNRKLNANKPCDDETKRVGIIQRAMTLAGKQFNAKYNRPLADVAKNEKKARNTVTLLAESARAAIDESIIKDLEIARLKADAVDESILKDLEIVRLREELEAIRRG